ncbi:hypothetical protein PHYSODRAFT_562478 [Phytophthora sojae]|uniref:Uncharacterized protein n=1 Tax=Phytophthora sojae (strain P6497) TaxID=1094619 RepID=G4ZQY7_PHYSP|nr:hypothetical protein PHYSODRAFT_562478 [Phytophthora sojae]EGZ14067.1 hypothetical protein PHYSODRAFT_562478 [Phytophthora sojae]|eukprot:XP_009531496.1 hypothetical protein PHYSODRAFT_562478 [Phytophthora sojae]
MSQTNGVIPMELRCTYRSKPCPNERARKRNGTLHKLCQTHRIKANKTQRDMQRRLREQRRQEQLERQLAAMQFNGEEFQAIELLDEFLKTDIPLELDTDTELDKWDVLPEIPDIPEPLEEPVDLNPEDIELLVALLGTSRTS